MTSHIAYRPEIDGLRAIAVIAVILFHAHPQALPGGFLGVDVFFVISGYLITRIVAGDLAAGRFSIATFYERRARRLLPALFVVLAVCSLVTLLIALPTEAVSFGRSMAATLLFASNVYFWRTADYFHSDSETTPLLHTWSLGVEEQFYLVFPLLLWAVWRWRRALAVPLLAVALLLSFAAGEYLWRHGKSHIDFYLPISRSWELLLGAIAALRANRIDRLASSRPALANGLSAAGLVLLLAALLYIDRTFPTPSVFTTVPTLGALLLIMFARDGTWAHWLLSRRPVVAIGMISYSAYLWHHPLFAYTRVWLNGNVGSPVAALLVAVTLALAYLTWRFVETPFRNRSDVPPRRFAALGGAAFASLLALALVIELNKGFIDRIPTADRGLAARADIVAEGRYVDLRFDHLVGPFTTSESHKILVIGDSYAKDFVNVLAESGASNEAEVRTYYMSSRCQIYFGPTDVAEHVDVAFRQSCKARREPDAELTEKLRLADVVVLSGFWQPWAAERLRETLVTLNLAPHQKLFVIGPKNVGKVSFRRLIDLTPDERIRLRVVPPQEIAQIESTLRQNAPEGSYVSIASSLCAAVSGCRQVTPDGELISFDSEHLTAEGARYVAQMLADPIELMLQY